VSLHLKMPWHSSRGKQWQPSGSGYMAVHGLCSNHFRQKSRQHSLAQSSPLTAQADVMAAFLWCKPVSQSRCVRELRLLATCQATSDQCV
jgi:hypothetical protein